MSQAVPLSPADQRTALDLWRAHGGETFGPHVEQVCMPLAKFAGFLAAFRAEVPAAASTTAPWPDPIYYLQAIARRLDALQASAQAEPGNLLGHMALADERAWLDDFIAQLGGEGRKPFAPASLTARLVELKATADKALADADYYSGPPDQKLAILANCGDLALKTIPAVLAELAAAADADARHADAGKRLQIRVDALEKEVEILRGQVAEPDAVALAARLAEAEVGADSYQRVLRTLARAGRERAEAVSDRAVLEAQLLGAGNELERLRGLIQWAVDTLGEINPSNYNHDDVCRLNDQSVEVALGLRAVLPKVGGGS